MDVLTTLIRILGPSKNPLATEHRQYDFVYREEGSKKCHPFSVDALSQADADSQVERTIQFQRKQNMIGEGTLERKYP